MDEFMGIIKLWAGNFEPRGWRFCNGQQLSIGENSALFALIGTTYGGDGVRTFNLPDMRGRFPLGIAGSGGSPGSVPYISLGQIGGSTTSPVTSTAPATKVTPAPATDTKPAAVSTAVPAPATSGTATNTLNPYLGLNYIICVEGIFPSRY